MALGKLILRGVIGSVFIAHGLQKLTGEFGGSGLEGTEKMMAATRMYPVRRNALAVALGETLAGASILLGAATPLGAFAAISTMATAAQKAHLKNGFFNSNRGYEFNLTLAAGAAAIAIDGPGPISVDALIGKSRWGAFCGLLAIGAGLVASSFAIEFGEDHAPASQPEPTPGK
ncbi:MAG: DoxX family protein [Pseudolysinimonas sp.]